MAATNALVEAELTKQATESVEGDVGVGRALEDPGENRVVSGHLRIVPDRAALEARSGDCET